MIAKLIRRHPHVFGDAEAESAGEVLRNWDRIKVEEEGRGAGEPFADLPENLPALLYARKVQRRAASAGLGGAPAAEDMPDPELRDAEERRIGEALFELVDEARRLRVDPELAVRQAAQRFRAERSDP
jgi:XTP/dITP diphosphohydrolase/tetrapyrrole methylase family protein/MazG family protein/ATP diphosphatase